MCFGHPSYGITFVICSSASVFWKHVFLSVFVDSSHGSTFQCCAAFVLWNHAFLCALVQMLQNGFLVTPEATFDPGFGNIAKLRPGSSWSDF